MPQFFISLLKLLQYLPGIIEAAEAIHGAGKGAQKLDTVIKMAAAAAPEIEAHIADPVKRQRLEKVVDVTVAAMNLAGKLQRAQAPGP